MYLLLVRHGESVDNVAGIYAGSRDSPLTTHGVLQTQRLGAHLASRRPQIGAIGRIFTSDLQRASRTADAVALAQLTPGQPSRVDLTLVPELRERDFRSWEGRTFRRRTGDGSDQPPHPDAETQEEMRIRVGRFLEAQLLPVLSADAAAGLDGKAVVVVAHGLILNVLLHVLLSNFASAELERLTRPGVAPSDFLASFSNTGYLEIEIKPPSAAAAPFATVEEGASTTSEKKTGTKRRLGLRIKAVNCVDHLQGLKKTRGGIGSAKFDSKQKTVDSFFGPASKKRKSEQEHPI